MPCNARSAVSRQTRRELKISDDNGMSRPRRRYIAFCIALAVVARRRLLGGVGLHSSLARKSKNSAPGRRGFVEHRRAGSAFARGRALGRLSAAGSVASALSTLVHLQTSISRAARSIIALLATCPLRCACDVLFLALNTQVSRNENASGRDVAASGAL